MLKTIIATMLMLAAASFAPDLNDRTFAQWKEYIRPRPDELAWQAIPWRATFWSAVLEAQRQDRPILLWTMNGHPLACT